MTIYFIMFKKTISNMMILALAKNHTVLSSLMNLTLFYIQAMSKISYFFTITQENSKISALLLASKGYGLVLKKLIIYSLSKIIGKKIAPLK